MYILGESHKALHVSREGVSFWIQKRWMRADGTLTKAGWKAYHIAAREYSQHPGFDALKEFEAMQETEKAVLLRCAVEHPDGQQTQVQFWLPRSMTRDFNFVSRKIYEIEQRFPFNGTRVKWSGCKAMESAG
jgi:hypothetical protein